MTEEYAELSLRQRGVVDTLIKAFHDKYGSESSPFDVLKRMRFETLPQMEISWHLVLICYPTFAFTFGDFTNLCCSVDEILIPKEEIAQDMISTPVGYFARTTSERFPRWKSSSLALIPNYFIVSSSAWQTEQLWKFSKFADKARQDRFDQFEGPLVEPARSAYRSILVQAQERRDFLRTLADEIDRLEDLTRQEELNPAASGRMRHLKYIPSLSI